MLEVFAHSDSKQSFQPKPTHVQYSMINYIIDGARWYKFKYIHEVNKFKFSKLTALSIWRVRTSCNNSYFCSFLYAQIDSQKFNLRMLVDFI